MGSSRKGANDDYPSSRPATTPEEQENRLISLAVAQAERMLEEGTAPTQVLNHYLKMASTREQKELEKLKLENELLKAKTDQIGSEADREKTYEKALRAFRGYSGQDEEDYDDY